MIKKVTRQITEVFFVFDKEFCEYYSLLAELDYLIEHGKSGGTYTRASSLLEDLDITSIDWHDQESSLTYPKELSFRKAVWFKEFLEDVFNNDNLINCEEYILETFKQIEDRYKEELELEERKKQQEKTVKSEEKEYKQYLRLKAKYEQSNNENRG